MKIIVTGRSPDRKMNGRVEEPESGEERREKKREETWRDEELIRDRWLARPVRSLSRR